MTDRPCCCKQRRVYDLCLTLGGSPPEPLRYCQDFAEWFAGTHPGGLLVETEGGYRLIERITEPPKQVKRYIIRTVTRAEASFARLRRKNLRTPRSPAP
jgi:hypothetical protein